MAEVIRLTREQLSVVFREFETLRQFELLLDTVDEINSTTLLQLRIDVDQNTVDIGVLDSTLTAHIADGTIHFEMLDEDDFASDSNTEAATQQSIGAYVRNRELSSTQTRITSGPYTVAAADVDIKANTDGGNIVVNLTAGTSGRALRVTNTGTNGNTVEVVPSGSEDLLGENDSILLYDGEALKVSYGLDGWD